MSRAHPPQMAVSPDELAELESAEDWVKMMAECEEQVIMADGNGACLCRVVVGCPKNHSWHVPNLFP